MNRAKKPQVSPQTQSDIQYAYSGGISVNKGSPQQSGSPATETPQVDFDPAETLERIGNINQTPSLMKAHPGAKGRTR
jgi:hypothetical protein